MVKVGDLAFTPGGRAVIVRHVGGGIWVMVFVLNEDGIEELWAEEYLRLGRTVVGR